MLASIICYASGLQPSFWPIQGSSNGCDLMSRCTHSILIHCPNLAIAICPAAGGRPIECQLVASAIPRQVYVRPYYGTLPQALRAQLAMDECSFSVALGEITTSERSTGRANQVCRFHSIPMASLSWETNDEESSALCSPFHSAARSKSDVHSTTFAAPPGTTSRSSVQRLDRPSGIESRSSARM